MASSRARVCATTERSTEVKIAKDQYPSISTHKLRFLSYLESDTADSALQARRAVSLSHFGRGLPRVALSSSAATSSGASAAAVARRRSPIGTAGFSVGQVLSVSRGLKRREEQRLDSISHHQSKWHAALVRRSLRRRHLIITIDMPAMCALFIRGKRASGRGLVSRSVRPSVRSPLRPEMREK